jgi:hypothetical protein
VIEKLRSSNFSWASAAAARRSSGPMENATRVTESRMISNW